MLKIKQGLAPKHRLNQTLRSWLPILQSPLEELKEAIEPLLANNPFASVEHKRREPHKNFFNEISKNSVTQTLEATTIAQTSLYEHLLEQINPPLFPTKKSQCIAYKIIECIGNEGYFEYDEQILGEFDADEIERVRARFAYLEPVGVGAKDLVESFMFQLDDIGCDGEIYESAKVLIENFSQIERYKKLKNFSEAMKIIKTFKNPPAIEYLSQSPSVVPEIIVSVQDGGISVSINDELYPEILLDINGLDESDEFIATRAREARAMIDALEMRKATLGKIGLMIVEYQYDYFFGGAIRPMKLRDIANELGRNSSTISRAIANKFLASPRGTLPLKSFFTAAVDEENDEISNASIKEFLSNLIKNENPAKPLSDLKILELTQAHFGVSMVRRTITKYRQALNIGSSSERRKVYEISG